MVQIYVAKTGNDTTGTGAIGSPYLTIGRGLDAMSSGDELIVGEGIYSNESNSTEGLKPKVSDITIRAASYPTLLGPTGGAMWSGSHSVTIDQKNTVQFGFSVEAKQNVTIIGFDVKDAAGVGINFGGNPSYGNTVRACKVHGCKQNGISATSNNLLTIDGNETYDNSKGVSGRSNISVYRSKNVGTGTLAGGYHIRVTNNCSHHAYLAGGNTSDGNGIIIDKLHYYSDKFEGVQTLVSGNYCYLNRGSGIRIMASKNCVTEFNTCYDNVRATTSTNEPGTWGGEISNQHASNNTFRYNIGVATGSEPKESGDTRVGVTGAYANVGNKTSDAEGGVYAATFPRTGMTVIGNIFRGIKKYPTWPTGIDTNIVPDTPSISQPVDPATNMLGVDPKLVAPNQDAPGDEEGAPPDLRIEDTSPAKNAAPGPKNIGAWQGTVTPVTSIEVLTAPILSAVKLESGAQFSVTPATFSMTPTTQELKFAYLESPGVWRSMDVAMTGTNPMTGTLPTFAADTDVSVNHRFTGPGVADGKSRSNTLTIKPVGTNPNTAPVNTSLPAISGTAAVGSTLSASTGVWSGNPAPTFTYQWKRDGVAISGATASTRLLSSDDLAKVITVTVTAANSEGSASATSPGTAAVTGTVDPDTLAGLTARVGTLEGQLAAQTSNVASLGLQVSALDTALTASDVALANRIGRVEVDTAGLPTRLSTLEGAAGDNSVRIQDLERSLSDMVSYVGQLVDTRAVRVSRRGSAVVLPVGTVDFGAVEVRLTGSPGTFEVKVAQVPAGIALGKLFVPSTTGANAYTFTPVAGTWSAPITNVDADLAGPATAWVEAINSDGAALAAAKLVNIQFVA